jgi:hypothetical protein
MQFHVVSPEVASEVSRVRQMAGDASTTQKAIPAAGVVTLDFDGARKTADMIREWSRTKDLALYHEAAEKGVYPWEALEQYDPSPRDLNGDIIVPLDAMERALYVLGINLSQATVDQFFAGPGMILMPAMALRWVRQGIQMANGASGVFTINRRVNGMNVNPIFLEAENAAGDAAKAPPTTSDRKRLGAAGFQGLPITRIGYRDKDVKVGVYGRDIQFDYKVVKYASMTELRLIFNFVGMQIGYDDIGNIFQLIDVGDGSSGAPPTRLQIAGATGGGTLVFSDLIKAIVRMQEGGFRVTHWIGESDSLIDFLSLSQFTGANERDQTLRGLLTGRGPFQTPLGTLLIAQNPPADADHLGFFDGAFAVAKGEEQPIAVETDKILQGQLEEVAIAGAWAFWRFAHDAAGMIDYS